MRISTAFFACTALFAVTFILYFAVELMGISSLDPITGRRRLISSSLSEKDGHLLVELEQKMAKVEKEIQRNQEIVVSLQARLSAMLTNQLPLLQNSLLDSQNNRTNSVAEAGAANMASRTPLTIRGPLTRLDFQKVVSANGQCPAGQMDVAKSDIQMQTVYDKLEFDNPDGGVWKQGWDVTYDESQFTVEHPLRVFVVPHSHNDPGWIKTFEEYFNQQTKHILDLAVKKLPLSSTRKFIWAEISYLSLWWTGASAEQRDTFKKLVKSGQMELVTGGWVMTDEANIHYEATLAQLIEGHEWIRNHLGETIAVRHGWAIDPFGVSSTMPYLLKLLQLDAMLIQRAHYSIKKHLAKEKQLEFKWRQTWDVSGKSDMLTHLMPFYSYDIPHTCGPDPKICCQFDFKRLPGSGRVNCPWNVPPRAINEDNVAERARTLLDQYKKKAQLYKTNVLFVPLGDDFRYDGALEWDQQYLNYERLIKYIDQEKNTLHAVVRIGTLGDYFDAVKQEMVEKSVDFASLSGDFFSYADRDDHYWSGYFTSRPFYKSLERQLLSALRSAEIAFAMAVAKRSGNFQSNVLLGQLVKARRNLALFQHHDGIAGTAKTHVMEDYTTKMLNAIRLSEDVLGQSLLVLMMSSNDAMVVVSMQPLRKYESWDKAATYSRVSAGRRVVVFNSLGLARVERVTVRVTSYLLVVVEEESGRSVVAQISPVWIGQSSDVATDEFELVFEAQLPALGAKSYLILGADGTRGQDREFARNMAVVAKVDTYHDKPRSYDNIFHIESRTFTTELELANQYFALKFDGATGFLKRVTYLNSDVNLDVALKFIRYGTTSKADKSGAYLFMPDGPASDVHYEQSLPDWHPSKGTVTPSIHVIRGAVVSELHVILPQVHHIVRVSHTHGLSAQTPEIENRVDVTQTKNYELAMHLTTGIKNADQFVTDMNAFQLIRRKTHSKLPLQANYYPMPSSAYLEDARYRLTLVGKQPLGVASLTSGCLEVMLDRRLDQDDNRGLGQPVHDNVAQTSSRFRLVVEANSPSKLALHTTQPVLSLLSHASLLTLLHPLTSLLVSEGGNEWRSFPGLAVDLPCDVHLLNVRAAVGGESEDQERVWLNGTTSGGGQASALMLLHRVGVDCRRETVGVNCSLESDQLDLKKTFKGIFALPFVEAGSPSPLHKADLIPGDGVVDLKAMEIHAYRFPLV